MLNKYKDTLLQTIKAVLIVLGIIFVYRIYNRWAFPGLIERGLFVLLILVVLFIISSLKSNLRYNKTINRLRFKFELMSVKYDNIPILGDILSAICDLNFRNPEDTGRKAINFVFQGLLVAFLLILLLKEFIVINFNINYLLISVIIFGILTIIFPAKQTYRFKHKAIENKDYYTILLLGIIGTVLIFIKTKQLGLISYFLSIIAGILIVTLSFLVLGDEDEY